MIMYLKGKKLLSESIIVARGKIDCYLGRCNVGHICWLCGIDLASSFHAIYNSGNVLLCENVSVAKVAPVSLALPAEAGLNVVSVLPSMLEKDTGSDAKHVRRELAEFRFRDVRVHLSCTFFQVCADGITSDKNN